MQQTSRQKPRTSVLPYRGSKEKETDTIASLYLLFELGCGTRIGLWPPPLRRARNKFLCASSLYRTCGSLTLSHQVLALSKTKEKAPALLRLFLWLRDQDSNLGPHGYEPCELPLLHPATMVMRQT